MGCLRFRRRPRAGRRAHRHHDRPRLRAIRRHRRGHGRLSKATRTRAAPMCPNRSRTDNVESMLGVIQQHRDAVEEIQPSQEFNYLKEEARQSWDRALEHGRANGFRNAQVTVLAPTGTIAFLMDCDTTGDRARHRAGEIQAAGRRRHAEDREPHRAGRAAAARLLRRTRSSASSRTSRSSTRSRMSRKTAQTIAQRTQARASAGVRLRVQALSAASAASATWRI